MHGGNVYAASRELACDVRDLLDFSASINPLGPSPLVWRAVLKARHLLSHYPDPECWELRQALAQRWQCNPEQLVVGNGSMELIHALPAALNLRHLLLVQPTFAEYAATMARTGGRVTGVSAKRSDGYALPIDRLRRILCAQPKQSYSYDGIVLCNPNSPTGQVCDAADLMELAQAAKRRGIWLIVDESFADYCPERSLLPRKGRFSRLVVLRSLTKFYALPGLRVGYAVADAPVTQRLRRHLPPWSVSAMGQVAALAALEDQPHAQRSLQFITKERVRFAAGLAGMPGCTVLPTYANYIFMELPRGWHAATMAARLRRDGLLIRDCSDMPGASARSIRVAVRSRRDNDRLLRTLAGALREGHA
ncbi:MAG: threonine-phosphate decarboxylase [Nitrospira sp.]|nr:threonine-phosphate decarboxylase [Nitrospira sp.]MBH0181719.1 threonine-phosphate decarboxylase [Nitrospira sp.]MBH0186330.1 threonine-phosphate decarboxylase [Nitrospira sp.]